MGNAKSRGGSRTPPTTDGSDDVYATIKYFPFGGCRNSQGSLDTDKLFTGQRLDDTGLYYYNARYYDATIGRFISADSIVPNYMNPQTLNRYSYCVNNPLKYIDPSGHETNDLNEDNEINVLDFILAKLNDLESGGGSAQKVLDAIFYGSAGVGDTNPGMENVTEVAETIIIQTLNVIPKGSYAEDLRFLGLPLIIILSTNEITKELEVNQANGNVGDPKPFETAGGYVGSSAASSVTTFTIRTLFTGNVIIIICYGTASAIIGKDVGETIAGGFYNRVMSTPLGQHAQQLTEDINTYLEEIEKY